jgi:hypothetical protein
VAQIIRQQGNWTRAPSSRNAGRHHVGTMGEIISECLGDFIGIRTVAILDVGWMNNSVEQEA